MVVVESGHILCAGICGSLEQWTAKDAQIIDLQGGSVSPGLVSFGSPLGLEEIRGEASTSDGYVFDPLLQEIPGIIGGDYSVIHAADGLQFTTRDAL